MKALEQRQLVQRGRQSSPSAAACISASLPSSCSCFCSSSSSFSSSEQRPDGELCQGATQSGQPCQHACGAVREVQLLQPAAAAGSHRQQRFAPQGWGVEREVQAVEAGIQMRLVMCSAAGGEREPTC